MNNVIVNSQIILFFIFDSKLLLIDRNNALICVSLFLFLYNPSLNVSKNHKNQDATSFLVSDFVCTLYAEI